MIRLDKYLADAGAGTRSEVKTLIRKGRITVNSIKAAKPEQKVSETDDIICLDDMPVSLVQEVYYIAKGQEIL